MPQIFAPLTLELAQGFLADASSLALSVRAGQQADLADLVDLASQARSLFLLSTLACRQLNHPRECLAIFESAHACFVQAQAAWDGVESGDPLLESYRRELQKLTELSRDRADLYNISPSERLAFVRRYRSDFVEDRSACEPNGDLSAEEKRIDQFLSLPI